MASEYDALCQQLEQEQHKREFAEHERDGFIEQLEQAQARVAQLEESGMELYGAILTNHRFFELRDDRLTDAMDDWLEVTAPKRQQADELEQQNGDTNAP